MVATSTRDKSSVINALAVRCVLRGSKSVRGEGGLGKVRKVFEKESNRHSLRLRGWVLQMFNTTEFKCGHVSATLIYLVFGVVARHNM